MKVLVAWIDHQDLEALSSNDPDHVGPIARALRERTFDSARLLYFDRSENVIERYRSWLKQFSNAELTLERMTLSSPMDISDIHRSAASALTEVSEKAPFRPELWFHLSAGTSAMVAVWILLGKTRFPGRFLQTSIKAGVETVEIPFDIAADFLPSVIAEADRRLIDRTSGSPPDDTRFGDILFRSAEMREVVRHAKAAAVRSYPILLVGESGTGKELLAKAIVNEARERGVRTGPLVSVNCGAIPKDMAESELFGHEKGAFTGAIAKRDGVFARADRGTLFLDEIGELPLDQQVKLLRVLQDKTFTPMGGSREITVNVRVIAATNRDLWEQVTSRTFRTDLLYRLDVMTIRVPRLGDRGGDLHYLIDELMKQINLECEEDLQFGPTAAGQSCFAPKKLSAAAKNLLGQQQWPGNVRQLQNTLRKAVAWAEEDTISEGAVLAALAHGMHGSGDKGRDLLPPLGGGIDLKQVLSNIAAYYLKQAMATANGNQAEANRLVRVGTPTTFANWWQTHVMDGGRSRRHR